MNQFHSFNLEVKNVDINQLELESNDKHSFPLNKFGFVKDIYDLKNKYSRLVEKYGKQKGYSKNLYEHKIQGYNKSLGDVVNEYFKLEKEPKILSRAFFKMWELIIKFNVVSLDNNFVSAHLAEGPGSFIQATLLYRKMKAKNSSNDKYYGITIHSEKKDVPEMDNIFIKHFSKNYVHHKTYSESKLQKGQDSGDLTKADTLSNFSQHFKKQKAHLITADGGFIWENENLQEQEASKLILGEIITAVSIQEKGGNFICKIFESFTLSTVQMIMLCKFLYEEVHIAKPYTSRQTNSEKYIVCLKFKGISDILLKQLHNIHKEAESKRWINSISINIPDSVVLQMQKINSSFYVSQYEVMNKAITCMLNNNSCEYDDDKQKKIEATKNWINMFFK